MSKFIPKHIKEKARAILPCEQYNACHSAPKGLHSSNCRASNVDAVAIAMWKEIKPLLEAAEKFYLVSNAREQDQQMHGHASMTHNREKLLDVRGHLGDIIDLYIC